MKRHYLIIPLLLLIVFVVWLLWFRDHPSPQFLMQTVHSGLSQNTNSPITNTVKTPEAGSSRLGSAQKDQSRKSAVEAMRKAFSSSIVFYGKVVDEKNNPIAGAAIHYSVANNPLKDAEKHESVSDANGRFSLNGVNGASLYVNVTKEGYYRIPEQSYGSIAYGVPSNSSVDRPMPTKDNPTIFILRTMGETEPLVMVAQEVTVPKNGLPVLIDLKSGRIAAGSRGDLVVECWTQNQGLDPNKVEPYDWRFKLTVTGGGVVERTSDFEFKAPTDGYRSVVEFTMSKDSEPWKQDFRNEYFLKLSDGRYARMKFRITTAGAHFASITSYLNPSGSRNLEYDPAKRIKVK